MSNSTISTTAFHCDDNKITDPTQIANRFCHYFSNIGINLTRKVPNSLILPCEFLKGNFSKSFFLHPVTECEMSEAAKSFKPGKAAGYDNIPMHGYNQTIY